MRFDTQKAKCALICTGKTQIQLAQEMTLSHPCLSKAMNGGSVNTNTAKRIAAALGVSAVGATFNKEDSNDEDDE